MGATNGDGSQRVTHDQTRYTRRISSNNSRRKMYEVWQINRNWFRFEFPAKFYRPRAPSRWWLGKLIDVCEKTTLERPRSYFQRKIGEYETERVTRRFAEKLTSLLCWIVGTTLVSSQSPQRSRCKQDHVPCTIFSKTTFFSKTTKKTMKDASGRSQTDSNKMVRAPAHTNHLVQILTVLAPTTLI